MDIEEEYTSGCVRPVFNTMCPIVAPDADVDHLFPGISRRRTHESSNVRPVWASLSTQMPEDSPGPGGRELLLRPFDPLGGRAQPCGRRRRSQPWAQAEHLRSSDVHTAFIMFYLTLLFG